MPIKLATIAGDQAAINGGTSPLLPNVTNNLDKIYNTNPPKMPARMAFPLMPNRAKVNETVAASNTMATNNTGADNSA